MEKASEIKSEPQWSEEDDQPVEQDANMTERELLAATVKMEPEVILEPGQEPEEGHSKSQYLWLPAVRRKLECQDVDTKYVSHKTKKKDAGHEDMRNATDAALDMCAVAAGEQSGASGAGSCYKCGRALHAKKLLCEHCEYAVDLTIEESLLQHFLEQSKPKVKYKFSRRNNKCYMCNKMFIGKDSLSIHTMRMHPQDETYRCNFCGKMCSCKNDLEIHLGLQQSEYRMQEDICPYVCNAC